MTELKKINLPNQEVLTEGLLFKSLTVSDLQEHFSITDFPMATIGTSVDLPAATVVFDLSGSSISIRNRGAKKFAAESQFLFRCFTEIIYRNHGIIEKFPGDGISMHFPSSDLGKERAIQNACEAIMQMDHFLHTTGKMGRDKYRFTLTYGDDTIITKFGSPKHEELISIGHSVNVAHKLEKIVKEKKCFIGMDSQCKKIAEQVGFSYFLSFLMPEDLCKDDSDYEFWFGVEY